MRRPSTHSERGFLRRLCQCQNVGFVAFFLLVCPATAFQTLSFPRQYTRMGLSGGSPRGMLVRDLRVERRSSSRQSGPLLMSSGTPLGHLDVSIDTPLFPIKVAKTKKLIWKSFLGGLLSSDALKAATFAFILALAITVLASRGGASSSVAEMRKTAKARFAQLKEVAASKAKPKVSEKDAVPMVFNSTETEGWGVCTLRSKKRLGKSSFVQYEFDLPRADNIVKLELGQQLSLCCLDNADNVAKGDFYLYHGDKKRLGTFSILAPNKSPDDNAYEVGKDAANFVRVLKKDLKVGDEVALKPGMQKLKYRGQYLPVTDMVYLAAGVGIVPVQEQIKAILPSGGSSVKSVSVVWINDETDDFDVTAEELEKEYLKHSTKLAVSCIVDDIRSKSLSDNKEVEEAIPNFKPGIMAVVSGPKDMAEKARKYLINRGYPDDCICVL